MFEWRHFCSKSRATRFALLFLTRDTLRLPHISHFLSVPIFSVCACKVAFRHLLLFRLSRIAVSFTWQNQPSPNQAVARCPRSSRKGFLYTYPLVCENSGSFLYEVMVIIGCNQHSREILPHSWQLCRLIAGSCELVKGQLSYKKLRCEAGNGAMHARFAKCFTKNDLLLSFIAIQMEGCKPNLLEVTCHEPT